MARILCIDYGAKRTGLAVTDPLQIIATSLETVATHDLIAYLKKYFLQESVELILIGYPMNLDDSATHATPLVNTAIKKLKQSFPQIPIEMIDERFSSKQASKAMVEMGMKKKQRQVKGNIDQIAATMLLQTYLQSRG